METENDEQRPYSVLTRDEVEEKLKKQIDQISEIFLLSKSEATVLLMYLRWDSTLVLERLGENKEKLFTESGLKPVLVVGSSNQDSYDRSCGICGKTGDRFYEFDDDYVGGCNDDDDDDDDDDLISTPLCSHEFCKICWREYLDKNFYSMENIQTEVSCPGRDCRAAVGPDTIEKLTVRDQEMYDKFILRSYVEVNKGSRIEKCPAQSCSYAIEFHRANDDEESSLNVVCLCGHIFCGRCRLESHRPVTCNNASDWFSRDLVNLVEESVKSSTISWIETNTMTCPHCHFHVQIDGKKWGRFLTCVCRGRFCWKCMKSEESHVTELGTLRACDTLKMLGSRPKREISCLDRWEAGQLSMQQAKSFLEAFEESNMKKPSELTEEYVRIIREGLMLVVQCRQILKWSCVYDYLHTEYDMSKKDFLRFLQEYAYFLVQNHSDTLMKQTERVFSATSYEELTDVMSELCSSVFQFQTTNIGNYFYHFIKTLQDGLVEVEGKSYDNYGGPHWLCDR